MAGNKAEQPSQIKNITHWQARIYAKSCLRNKRLGWQRFLPRHCRRVTMCGARESLARSQQCAAFERWCLAAALCISEKIDIYARSLCVYACTCGSENILTLHESHKRLVEKSAARIESARCNLSSVKTRRFNLLLLFHVYFLRVYLSSAARRDKQCAALKRKAHFEQDFCE